MDRTLSDSFESETDTLPTSTHALDDVMAQLLSAAADTADTLLRLLKCGDPIVELRAARTILQMAQKGTEAADMKKKAGELERTNTVQAQFIEKLETANKALQQSKEELNELTHSLMTGTFQRPAWLTHTAWSKIVSNNATAPLAT